SALRVYLQGAVLRRRGASFWLHQYHTACAPENSAILRWHSYQMEKGQNIIRNLKRHSDGTFTNDFTRYLDKIKAKDFVEWLASTKRQG
uniref:Glucagon / GIP / secretin / VIP family domain-containing protein n=1 Tax=Lates calcarifer TaxID=8187 RepID=A0A4W6ELV7_LATCA